MPDGADRLLFRLAPYISFCASFAAFLALPFADGWVAMRLNVGGVLHPGRAGAGSVRRDPGRLCLGLEVVAVRRHARGGPGGQLRSAAGHVRGGAGADRRLDGPGDDRQHAGRAGSRNWFIFHDPFTFITFWVYFTCATASVNRAPFDLAEAESELVAGFHTEYSGLRWSIFFMAEYGSMFAVSGLAAILFFGGWNGPLPIAALAGPGRRDEPGAALPRQLAGHAEFHRQVRVRRDLHDVGPLDAAAAADRPGDDDLLEILHADRRRDVRWAPSLWTVPAARRR